MEQKPRYDIRRQTTLDITNALTSVTRMRRVLRETPRHTDKGTSANAAEVQAAADLEVAENALVNSRASLETLDQF